MDKQIPVILMPERQILQETQMRGEIPHHDRPVFRETLRLDPLRLAIALQRFGPAKPEGIPIIRNLQTKKRPRQAEPPYNAAQPNIFRHLTQRRSDIPAIRKSGTQPFVDQLPARRNVSILGQTRFRRCRIARANSHASSTVSAAPPVHSIAGVVASRTEWLGTAVLFAGTSRS